MKFTFGGITVETRGEPAVGGGFKGVARGWWEENGATLTRDTVFETIQATAAEADIHAAAQMRIRAEAGML